MNEWRNKLGYEPKGIIQPDPALRHECRHENKWHYCHCKLGQDHTMDEWLATLPDETKPVA